MARRAGVAVADLRAMLGLSDRGEIIDLFELAMRGEIARGARARRRSSITPAPTRPRC